MAHQYSDASVAFRIHASHAAGAWIALAAASTIGLAALTPAPLAARIAAATWLACAALEAIHSRALLRGPRAARALRIEAGAVQVEDGDGHIRNGTIRPGSFVAPWLTVIRWRPEGSRWDRTVPLLPGMLEPESFRRLRVLLRFA